MAKDYHAPMHTAEHILNQTMVRMFGCGRSFSNHIERRKSKCDYHFTRNVTDEEKAELERRVNEVIGRNLAVQESVLDRAEAAAKFNLERLPADAGDRLRIISIGDYDACPCSGQHVAATGVIGRFSIISSDFADGVLRLRFRIEEGNGSTPAR